MLDLAETGYDQIREVELMVGVKKEMVKDAQIALDTAKHQLQFTQVRAPFPGVVVKRYRNLGDFCLAGVPILSMYNPDLLYVTANLEETRLRGVAPGNPVELQLDAFDRAVHGPGRLDQQIDRRAVRADAAQRRLRRVHQGRAARAGAHLDREGRALAAACGPVCRSRSSSPTARATPRGPSRRPRR